MRRTRQSARAIRLFGVLVVAVVAAWLAVPALAAPGKSAPPPAQTSSQNANTQSAPPQGGSANPDAATNNNGQGVCTTNPNNNPSNYPVCKKCPHGWVQQGNDCQNPCPTGYKPTGGPNNPKCQQPKNPNQYCQAQYGNGWHFDHKSGDCVQDHKDSAGGPPSGTCYGHKVSFNGKCVDPNQACQMQYNDRHAHYFDKTDKAHPAGAGCYDGKTYKGPLTTS